jgi:hypothetical protein
LQRGFASRKGRKGREQGGKGKGVRKEKGREVADAHAFLDT